MKILFTGASSFTGYWFIKELVKSGHEVTATFTKKSSEYDGIRKIRVDELIKIVNPLFETNFGDENFINAIESNKFDVFCNHAAYVGGTSYKDLSYDIPEALAQTTININLVSQKLSENGCKTFILTGSIFEENEGKGETKAFSPYGLTKEFSFRMFEFYAHIYKMNVGKFVIPNPFGPMEEPKFTTYMAKTWLSDNKVELKTPDYVRDNIPVDLLAKVYLEFVENTFNSAQDKKINPSFYVGTLFEFAKMYSEKLSKRLGKECLVAALPQSDFTEEMVLENTDKIDTVKYSWDEEKFWDNVADFYKQMYI